MIMCVLLCYPVSIHMFQLQAIGRPISSFIYFSTLIVISFRTSIFSFRESYFRLVGLFDLGYARTQFLLSVSRNRYGFTLAGYRNEKFVTDPALIRIILMN